MRRFRIKPVLTAPVRRKPQQDAQSNPETDLKQPQKASEEIQTKLCDNSVLDSTLQNKATESKQSCNNTTTKSTPQNEEIETKSPCAESTVDSTLQKENISHKPLVDSSVSPEKEAETHSDINHTVKIYDLPIVNESTSKVESVKKVNSSIDGSPAKIVPNRSCFMRPTPRLDGGGRIRRNSIQGSANSGASASESEDDTRKSSCLNHSRISDLTSSTDRPVSNSGVLEGNHSGNANNAGKLNLTQKRRMVVSESARKLAEARREFLLKHENNTPDKSKLTMYDLIYYNPKTNPMKPKPVTAIRKISVSSDAAGKEEKEQEKEKEAPEEPSEILVPQVKIGPNGQLIIDEKSLVIDKAEENVDRSEIVVDDDNTGNGFYKKRAKSKEWNKWETMKFYKALNTYGTDFLLMQSVFPKRTRQELKLKYKKEEKLNSNLVEKALRYQAFDTEALQKDLAIVEESERKEAESIKLTKENSLALKNTKKTKRCRMVTKEVSCESSMNSLKNSSEEQSSDENSRITITKSKKLCKRILVPVDNSDSDEETQKTVKKTRRKKK